MSKESDRPRVVNTALLSDGKSARLKSLHNKAMGVEAPTSLQVTNELTAINLLDKNVKEELLYARKIIDKHLADILSDYPTNKRVKLFKIRFGLSVGQMKELSIKEMCSILKMEQKVPKISGINYFGRKVLK